MADAFPKIPKCETCNHHRKAVGSLLQCMRFNMIVGAKHSCAAHTALTDSPSGENTPAEAGTTEVSSEL